MQWKWLFQLRDYLKSSLWIVPLVAIPLELATIRILIRLDSWLAWSFLGIGAKGADAMLNSVVTATLSFVVFTFGSLLVALQVASGQMTPRIIATILVRDNVVRYTAGLFIFTLLFSISAMNRIEDTVPQLVVFVGACLGVLCFAAFLYLIDYAARLLRPISIVSRVGQAGLAVIQSVYPNPTDGPTRSDNQHHKLGSPIRIIPHQGTSEVILAANLDGLVVEAEKSNGVIEFVLHCHR